MAIVNSIISWINYKRIYQIDLYREHARDIQEELLFDLMVLREIVNGGKNTITNRYLLSKIFNSEFQFQLTKKLNLSSVR